MPILPIPCLRDNYAYLVWKEGSSEALVVDPSEAPPVLRALEAHELQLGAVLATHHHADHVGGIEGLYEARGPFAVYAHRSERARVPRQSEDLLDGQLFHVVGMEAKALHVPGHTRGAVAYLLGDALFTGDTLFGAGCGRLFEGTPAQMWESLQRLRGLPSSTRVYCGHEYTLANLRFAAHCEPRSAAIQSRLEAVQARRERGEPSVPFPLAEELQTNPFLRADTPVLAAAWGRDGGALAAFTALRAAKDTFQG